MNRINKIKSNLDPEGDKQKPHIPKSKNTLKTLKLETITPELLHNIEDPTLYMTDAKKKAETTVENFRSLIDMDFKYKEDIFQKIMLDPNFLLKDEEEFTIDELKNYINNSLIRLVKIANFTYEDFLNFNKLTSLFEVAGIINSSLATKIAVHYGLFCKSIQHLGTEKHMKLLKKSVAL